MAAGSADVHGIVVGWCLSEGGLGEGVELLQRFPPTSQGPGVSWRVSARPPSGASVRSTGVHFGSLSCEIHEGGAVRLLGAGAGAVVEAGGRSVEVWGEDPAECRLAASMALHFTLYQMGLFHVHAGAVVRSDGAAVLIVGPSGSGKTTTTLSLLEGAGAWQWLSDDTVYLAPEAGSVRVRGLPSEFHVTDATLRAFPFLGRHDAGSFAGAVPKRRIEPRTALAGREGASAREARMILFPRIVPEQRTSLAEVEPTRAYPMLLESAALALLQLPGHLRHLDALATLVQQASCYSLLLGQDALAAPELVAGLVGSAVAESGAASPDSTTLPARRVTKALKS